MLEINELKEYNPTYDTDYYKGVKEEDLNIVNAVLEGLSTIDRSTPQVGDIVILVSGKDKVKCHLERLDLKYGGNLCQNCGSSHISNWKDSEYYCSTSGGPWTEANPETFKPLGTTTRWFWTWGRHGVGAGNGIYFPATVSMWEVEVENAYIPHPIRES